MTNMLFTNVRILDGTGAPPFAGDVLVQGNRILRVGRGARSIPAVGATVIDGAGATLMPGMVEAHTHFSWNDSATLEGIQRMPLEEHVLWSAHVAKRYLEAGFTSCLGAACAKPRLDVVTRNAINEGMIPGPRYLAASQEITVAGALGDETLPHLPFPEFSFGVVVSGPEEMRRADRNAVFVSILKAVAEKQYKKWQIVGGAFSQKEFSEIPAEGGYLIGFYYTTISKGQYPGDVQAYFEGTFSNAREM